MQERQNKDQKHSLHIGYDQMVSQSQLCCYSQLLEGVSSHQQASRSGEIVVKKPPLLKPLKFWQEHAWISNFEPAFVHQNSRHDPLQIVSALKNLAADGLVTVLAANMAQLQVL